MAIFRYSGLGLDDRPVALRLQRRGRVISGKDDWCRHQRCEENQVLRGSRVEGRGLRVEGRGVGV